MENGGSDTGSEEKYLYLGNTELQHIAWPSTRDCKAGREFTCDGQGDIINVGFAQWEMFPKQAVASITTRFCLARYDWLGKVDTWWSPAMRRRWSGGQMVR